MVSIWAACVSVAMGAMVVCTLYDVRTLSSVVGGQTPAKTLLWPMYGLKAELLKPKSCLTGDTSVTELGETCTDDELGECWLEDDGEG